MDGTSHSGEITGWLEQLGARGSGRAGSSGSAGVSPVARHRRQSAPQRGCRPHAAAYRPSPNGTLISTTNIETAEGGLADFSSSTILNAPPPPGFVALFPSMVPQLESDPQTTFANIPTWALTNLTNLADANGFGFVPDPTAMLNEPPYPAVVAFEAQLANVGGPFITTSDTGFQTQPFSLAYCKYVNALLGTTSPCVLGPPGTSQYEFTYQLGPYMNGGNTYTSFVNFQIYPRDVTEQLLARPEPGMIVPLGIGFVAVGVLRRKRVQRA